MSAEQQSYYDDNARARWLVLISVCLALFVVSLTMSSANIAIPSIAQDLNADAVSVSWIPSALLWGSIIIMLPIGRLADKKGRKKLYLIGCIGFSFVSLSVILVQNIEALLALRVFQGLSTAFIFGTGLAIISSVFANSNRGTAIGITSSTIYFGLSCGPVVGGWITQHIHWKGVFLMPIPLMLVALLLIISNVKGDWKNEESGPIDWVGSVLFALSVSAFFIGVSELPDPLHILYTIIGILLFVVFIKHQNRTDSPLIRIKALNENKALVGSMYTSILMYSANFPIVFLLSLYLQYIHNLSPSEAGSLLLIETVIMMILSPFSGRLSDIYGAKIITTVGGLTFSLGFMVLVWVDMDTSMSLIIISLILLGIGFGLFSTPNNSSALGSVSGDKLSIVSSIMNLSRTMGNMLSTAFVLMLMSIVLGDVAIQSENYPLLLLVVQITFGVSLALALLASYISYYKR
ncbi:MFS transporter [Marinomonas algicola]|uniref:MFS transporter n=1 Tax=Marinomonas algicola TaxID=2773454 RepID=UPI00174ADD19|nr:MFS transporter [Marinomonas algicola]